ncbi:hypothetical protein KZX45_12610 [Georgenia sp. EYE_87]|uniref:hypothetical protein n=1 Tax=Georgenia sp. EYE_87 TaxID=2853448 RepID=UPI0020046BF3|nr:hypothetical protein [Georgenia sp. EYE_87]MCK6211385.1 hypothetical protein [Georgenia sp. EYE_87]
MPGRLGYLIALGAAVALAGCADGTGGGRTADPCRGEPLDKIDDDFGERIVFASDRSGSADLWSVAPDGTDLRQLTDLPGAEGTAAWSPDGRQLAFTAFADAVPEDFLGGDICILDSSGLRNLTGTERSSEFAPTWSPDGELAFVRMDGRRSTIVAREAAGPAERELAQGDWPAWSPDGATIAFARGVVGRGWSEQLWAVDADGGSLRPLTEVSDGSATQPAWSPDGRRLSFSSGRDGDPQAQDPLESNEEIYLMDAGGGNHRRLTAIPGNDHWPASWSPDGRRLAFTSDGEGDLGDIVVVDVESLETTYLTEDEHLDAFPAWRPALSGGQAPLMQVRPGLP